LRTRHCYLYSTIFYATSPGTARAHLPPAGHCGACLYLLHGTLLQHTEQRTFVCTSLHAQHTPSAVTCLCCLRCGFGRRHLRACGRAARHPANATYHACRRAIPTLNLFTGVPPPPPLLPAFAYRCHSPSWLNVGDVGGHLGAVFCVYHERAGCAAMTRFPRKHHIVAVRLTLRHTSVSLLAPLFCSALDDAAAHSVLTGALPCRAHPTRQVSCVCIERHHFYLTFSKDAAGTFTLRAPTRAHTNLQHHYCHCSPFYTRATRCTMGSPISLGAILPFCAWDPSRTDLPLPSCPPPTAPTCTLPPSPFPGSPQDLTSPPLSAHPLPLYSHITHWAGHSRMQDL